MSEATLSGLINPGTLVISLDAIRRLNPTGFREAFLAVYPQALEAARKVVEPILWVAATDSQGALVGKRKLRDSSTLTIGRHDRCRLCLPGHGISLRHLVAHYRIDEEGRAVTRVWDLRSSQPFYTEDGRPSSALMTRGPLLISVGEYVLIFLPMSRESLARMPDDAEAAWDALPPRVFADHRTAAAPGERDVQAGALSWLPVPDDRAVTMTTLFNAPVNFEGEPLRGDAWALVSVETRERRIEQWLSSAQVEQGLLFGRYSRCQLSMGGYDEHSSLSRVHLFIVRIGSQVWAIDTASTNGTSYQGKRVRAMVLGERENLVLAGSTTLKWRVRSVAEA